MQRQTGLATASLLVLLAGAGLHVVAGYSGAPATSIHAQGTDDAYITYRYAANLALGEGLVFNRGERVEGFSSLFHVLLLAPILAVAPRAWAYPAASLANLGFLALAFLLAVRAVERRFGSAESRALAVVLSLCPQLWLWAASGMESIAVVALQVWLWLAVEEVEARETDARAWLGLAAGTVAAVGLRAEGFLFPLPGVIYLLLRGRRRAALRLGALAALSTAALLTWRLAYYGALLPNTYYAKVSGPLADRIAVAARQLAEVLLHQGFALPLLALAFGLARSAAISLRGRSLRGTQWTYPGIFGAWLLLYWFYVGGDHFGERFLLILLPLGFVAMLQLLAEGSAFRGPARGRALVVLALVVASLQLPPLLQDRRFAYRYPRYDGWIELGRLLGENYPHDTWLATGAAGKVPFYSRLPTFDLGGLTEPRLARTKVAFFRNPGHDKVDPSYALARRPDLIAHWILPDLSLANGLERDAYLASGYRLRYLLQVSRSPAGEHLVDVSALEEDAIRQRVGAGYAFAVLERTRP